MGGSGTDDLQAREAITFLGDPGRDAGNRGKGGTVAITCKTRSQQFLAFKSVVSHNPANAMLQQVRISTP